MTHLILALAFAAFAPQDTIPPRTAGVDTLRHGPEVRTDTLKELEVRGDTVLRFVRDFQESLGKQPVTPKVKTLGDIIEKYLPGFNDCVTHPFAIKERKRERKHKRDRKILQEYDRIQNFNDLLDAAVRRQQIEDEEERRRKAEDEAARK